MNPVIIIAMTQFLSLFLARIRQPRVIAEVIGGIILGPTVMGRIPGFRATIFPDVAMAGLNLTSTIGLILFLFLVGLEIDTKVIKRNLASAGTISLAGLIIPLGLGAALGVGIYKEFIDPSVNFGYFLLFTAVAVGITAFPVLCRILTELKLLDTTVGVVTLAAGVGNDVVGWILLALVVALVNASTGLTALYVLLACVGFIILLLFPGRWAFVWIARRTGSLEQGSPTPTMMTITLLVVFGSAFFTDIIGVHAIFGTRPLLMHLLLLIDFKVAFWLVSSSHTRMVSPSRWSKSWKILYPSFSYPSCVIISVMVPFLTNHNTSVFHPFRSTDQPWVDGQRDYLGLHNHHLLGILLLEVRGVLCGSQSNWFQLARSRCHRFPHELQGVSSLIYHLIPVSHQYTFHSLVELIVLNIGLQAGILDTRTFSMFVVHALILTFMTTPLTLLFYPPKYRTRDMPVTHSGGEAGSGPRPSSDDETKTRFAIVLDKIEQVPAAMTISQLLQSNKILSPRTSLTSIDEKSEKVIARDPFSDRQITINALRLIELTNRTSAVLKSKVADSLIYNDPVVSVFKTFGYLNRLIVSTALSVVNYDEFTGAITKHVVDSDSQMVILPWSRGTVTASDEPGPGSAHNPFDGIFHKTTTQDQTSSVVYSEFIRNVFLTSPTNVALFVDRGLNTQYTGPVNQHLFLPFFGGPDDRLALSFIVQLCSNPSVQATVYRIDKTDDLSPSTTNLEDLKLSAPHPAILHQVSNSPYLLHTFI